MKAIDHVITETKIISLERLKPHPHEQESRVTESAIAPLQADILASRFIESLVVMADGDDYIVIDGNRRLKIAQTTGLWDRLKCEVLPASCGDIDIQFVRLNAHARTMRGNERMNFIAKLKPEHWKRVLDLWPNSFVSKFRELERAIGRKELIEMGMVGKYGPDIMGRVRPLQATFTRFGIGIDDGEVVRWLVVHTAQNVVNGLTRQPGGMSRSQAKRLESAILNNEPYRLRQIGRPRRLVVLRRA